MGLGCVSVTLFPPSPQCFTDGLDWLTVSFSSAYTNFTYSALTVTPAAAGNTSSSYTPTYTNGTSTVSDLYAPLATVTATIANAGDVAGAEVVQLYLSLPDGSADAPPRQLRGFEKIALAAGESGTVKFVLRKKDASFWSVEQQRWVLPSGEFAVAVAASSRDLRLEGVLVV